MPILDDAIKGLENVANIIGARAGGCQASLQFIISGTLGTIYDIINQTGIDARIGPKIFVLDYLDDLIQRGVTPDRALEFIADCEHDKLPDASKRFRQFLDRCGEWISSAGPAVLAQMEPLKAVMADLIAEMGKEGNGEATMADVIAKARAGLDMLWAFSTDPPDDIDAEDFGEEHQEPPIAVPEEKPGE